MRVIFAIPMFAFLMFYAVSAQLAEAQVPGQLNLMPAPASMQMGTGQLVVDSSFSVGIGGTPDPQLRRAVDRFLNNLRRETGMLPLDMSVADASKATFIVTA